MINNDIDKLTQAADLPDTKEVLPETQSPFIVSPQEQQEAFTGESADVAINLKEAGQFVIEKFSKGKKAKTVVDEVNVNGNPETIAAPTGEVKVTPQKPVTKAKQKEINKIKEEAAQQPIVSTEEMQAVGKDEAGRAAFKEEMRQLDIQEGVAPSNNFNTALNSLEDFSDESIDNLIIKSINLNKKTQSHDELIQMAEKTGFDAQFLRQLREGTNFSETVVKSIQIGYDSLTKIKDLAQKSVGLEKTSAEYLDILKEMQTYRFIMNKSYGISQDAGRALAAHKIKPDSINIREDIESLMSTGNLDDTMKMMLNESLSDATKGNIIKAALEPKNGWAKAKLLYTSGLLGRFGTQAKAAVGEIGNALVVEPITRSGAAASWYATYPVKKLLGMDTEEKYLFTETMAMYKSLPVAISNGWNLAKDAWTTGRIAGSRQIDADKYAFDIMNYSDDNQLLNKGIKLVNLFATYGPRTLAAGGDFFKGVHHRMKIEAEAVRKEIQAYDAAINANADPKDAELIAANARQMVYDNPPEALFDEARAIVLEAPLPKFLEGIERIARRDDAVGLAAKFTFAFGKTSINEFMRLVEYTPVNVLVGPAKFFWQAAKSGSIADELKSMDAKKVDMALSKIGVGTMAMGAGVHAAMNERITGKGPTDVGLRQAMERQGWQRYSLAYDISAATPEELDKWKKIPGSTLGTGDYKGKIFISYSGTGLIGAWLSMSANVADYMRYEKNVNQIQTVVYGSAMGLGNVLSDSPYVNGIAEAVKMFQLNNYGDESKMVDEIAQGLVSTGLRKAEHMIPGIGIFRTARDYADDRKRNVNPDPTEQNPALRGTMDALNELMNSIPGLSDELPPIFNIYGEPANIDYPGAPFRTTRGKQRLADRMMIQTGANVIMPKDYISEKYEFDTLTIDANGRPEKQDVSVNIKLTHDEYKELLSIANNKYNLESEIEKLNQNLEKYNRLYAADEKGLTQEQINRRKIKVIETLKTDIETKVAEIFEKSRDDLYERSDYSSALKERAEAQAEAKMSKYKFPDLGVER